MDPALAHREIRIAAKWWRDLLVRRHDEALSADLFASLPEHAPIPIRPERADAFHLALVAEIEGTFDMDLVLWDAAVPQSGAGLRKLEVVGTRAPPEVERAADSAGLAHALRLLPDGAMTAINPGHVVAYAGRTSQMKLESLDVQPSSRGGPS